MKEIKLSEIIRILMQRDGLSKAEAVETVKNFMEENSQLIENGDYDALEEALMGDLGLEPDYIEELIY